MLGCYAKSGAGVRDKYLEEHKLFSAFTVAELGEMLSEDRDLPWQGNGVWFWSVMSEDGTEKTEADARAKMLIYLAEHGPSSPTEKQSTVQ